MSYYLRSMQREDLSQVLAVQKQTFGTELCETLDVFTNRFEIFGEFFKVVVLNNLVQGYMICFPWRLGESPMNNEKFPESLPSFNCFYLHDIALLKQARGSGLAQELINHALLCSKKLGFNTLSLVSVEQAGDYWVKRGFSPFENLPPEKDEFIRSVYGQGARLMVMNF